MTKKLQGGYTTGACAAAGVMAALLFLHGESPAQVKLSALDGTVLVIPVRRVQATEDGAEAEIVNFRAMILTSPMVFLSLPA